MRASEKRSISTNGKSTMRFPSSHRWTLCVTPKSPKGWLKTKIFTFSVAFHFFVAGNRRHFKLLNIASASLRTTNCPWKGRGHCHVTSNFWKISDNISKTVRDSLIVSIKFEKEVVCALSIGYVADDLGWPLSTLNHRNFYILHCLMYRRNWRPQRLQIWCKGWMCKWQPTDD